MNRVHLYDDGLGRMINDDLSHRTPPDFGGSGMKCPFLSAILYILFYIM